MLSNRQAVEFLVGGATLKALSGERRQAYFRQWKITGLVVVVLMVSVLAFLLPVIGTPNTELSGRENALIALAIVLLGAQFIYAVIRRDTIWQLRIREIRHRVELGMQNEQDLLDYATGVQKRGTGSDS